MFNPVRALYGGGRLWRPEPIAIVGSISITVIAFAVATLIHALPTGRDMRDFVGILDGAYKISQGLIPHVDFAVPHGAWPLYQAVPVLWLLHRVQPLALYQVIGWLSILPAAIPIALRQSDSWRAVAVLAFVALATLIPCTNDYN